ncbi:hypothetical protein CspHIS471_0606610 [Cutaneotrichosporon sp. HIS471]|nr:hypothetical protein CspHIS471_0606610 [Cutaneotrichosporon sp. HIS471]
MSQQASTTGPGSTTTATGRKRKKSPKPKETKRAPGDAPKRTKMAQRKEQEAAEAAETAGMGGSQTMPHSQITGDDDEVVAPRSPNRRRRVINTDPPETPTLSHAPGHRVTSQSQSTASHPGEPNSNSSHSGTATAVPVWGPSTPPNVRRLLEAQSVQIRELSLCMRETGLIMRELLKVKLGQPASMPPTPTLDGGVTGAACESTSQPAGVPRPGENGLSAGSLGLFHNNTENRPSTIPPNIGDRGILGIGQPPPRVPINAPNNSISYANGVAFNIGSITQPVTVAPLPLPEVKVESANPSPVLPSSAHQSEGHHHPLHPLNLTGSSHGDPHPPPSAPTTNPMFRDASQPLMSDTARNPSFPMPGRHTSIQTPQIPSTQQEDQNMTPGPAPGPPQGVHGYMLPNQTYTLFPQNFMRPALTPQQQQQAIHQHMQQQQQQQAQIMAHFQRQSAMARQGSPYYAQHQQMAGLHPGIRTATSNPAMGRPPRPFMNINTGLGIMTPGDEAERSASDPPAHTSPPRMSPSVQQFERLQRQAVGYGRQASGQVSASPSNPTTNFLPHQFPGPGQAQLAQNPFLNPMGLSMPTQQANGVAAPQPVVGGFGVGPPPGAAPTMPSGAATNGIGTPNMYNLYAEQSPFSTTFAGVSGGNEIPSPFSFAPPEMGEGGGVGRPRWGEEEADEEPLRELTPGNRFDSK